MEHDSKSHSAALVLSGGGALGAAHVGCAREILRHFQIDFFAGTSAGAIVAAGLACGMAADEISNQIRQKRLLALAFDLSIRGSGLLRGNKVLTRLEKTFEGRNFSDLPRGVQLIVCATDFESGELVVFDSGSIAEAVRASLSMPGVFEPYKLGGRLLVDGGLVANLPVGPVLERYQGEMILAVDVCSSLPDDQIRVSTPGKPPRISFRKSIERSLRIMFRNQQSAFSGDPRVKIVRPDLFGFAAFNIAKLGEIEERGAKAFRSSGIIAHP